MNFTGTKFRSLLDRDRLTFSVDMSINNVTGSGSFGFSGNGSKMQWVFDKGKVFDPDNSYVFSYGKDEEFVLAGGISGSGYQYSIDGEDILFGGSKYTGDTQGFYFNLSGCEVEAGVTVKTDNFNHSLTFPTTFTYSDAITGHLSGIDTGYNFQVFSGVVNSPLEFTITGLNTSRTGVLPIKIQHSGGGAILNTDYQFNVDLYTNFGTVSKRFQSTASLSDPTSGSEFNLTNNGDSVTGGAAADNSIQISTGTGDGLIDYTLNYTLTNNLLAVTGGSPLTAQLTHNSGTTGDFVSGNLVTGLQFGSIANGLFTGTPTITFSSTYTGDEQASGTAVMADYLSGDVLYSGGTSDSVVFKTIVGANITNSGHYIDPTNITISISGNKYSTVNTITGFSGTAFNIQPNTLSYTGNYFGYSGAINNLNYSNSVFSSGSNGNITSLFTDAGTTVAVVPLTKSGEQANVHFSGLWTLATGTNSQILNFNTGTVWQSIYTGYPNEVAHPSGNQTSGTEYNSSVNTTQNNINARVRFLEQTKQQIITPSEVKTVTNYLTGSHTEETTYSNLYSNPPTISFSPDMNGLYVVNKLKEVITGTILQGSTGSIDIKYSFIDSGTSGHGGLGTIKKIDDYDSSYPNLSFTGMTGMFATGFEYWKRSIEYAFTGLTVNFVNLGLETTTGVATNASYAVGTNNLGDIRIGASATPSIYTAYYPESGNNFTVSGGSGSNIFLSTTQIWRDETSDSYYDGGLLDHVSVGGYSVPFIAAQSIGMALGIDNEFDNNSVTNSVGLSASINLHNTGQLLDGSPTTYPSKTKNPSLTSGYVGSDIDAVTYLYGNSTGSHTVYEQKNALTKITGSKISGKDYIATLSLSGSGSLSATKNITGDFT